MSAALISGLDHVALVVRDLDRAAEQITTLLGRSYNWRGADGGAEHVWFQLNNMALDVIAPIGTGFTGDQVRAHIDAEGEGLWALAFATPDAERARAKLARRGVEATAPRRIRSTNTGERRYWTMSTLAREGAHGPLVFLIDQPEDAAPWPRSESLADACVTGLDHVVVRSPAPDRAAAFYGARLGLDMRLDRAHPEWGARLIFFRCGDLTVEIAHDLKAGPGDGPDTLWGLSWRVESADLAHARLAECGFNVSTVRDGRKPGTRVFSVRDKTCGVPTLMVEHVER